MLGSTINKHDRKTGGSAVRVISFFIALLLAIRILPLWSAGATTYDYTTARSLLNGAELHPQKTGFVSIDNRVEELLSGFRKKTDDTFSLVLAAYDWLVYNVKYEKNLRYYSKYDYSSRTVSPVSFYAVYFGYEPLFKYEGVCDNFSSAFVIMARAIGLDAYLRSGKQYASGRTYDHMWVEIMIDGAGYIFDPQTDNSIYNSSGKNKHYYFGRATSTLSSMYRVQDSSRIKNADLNKGFTPVSQTPKSKYCYVTYAAGGNGTVSDNATSQTSALLSARVALFNNRDYAYSFDGYLEGTHIASFGTSVTLTARPDSGESFKGWYVNNTLVSESSSYTFTAEKDVFVEAVFTGERFSDVPKNSWYHDAVYLCDSLGFMNGVSVTSFAPNKPVTRAMAVQILARMAKFDPSLYSGTSFPDVPEGKWYSAAVKWASEAGITSGYEDGTFRPDKSVSREQLAVFMWRLAGYLQYGNMRDADLSGFVDIDQAHDWALAALKWAYSLEIMTGNEKKEIQPLKIATRAETAVMVRKFRLA